MGRWGLLVLGTSLATAAALFAAISFAHDEVPNEAGEVRHPGPKELGDFEVVEVPDGLAAKGPVEVSVGRDIIHIPQAKGITWAIGDVSCGYGLLVNLPGRTAVCFSQADRTATISDRSQRDGALLAELLSSNGTFRVVEAPP